METAADCGHTAETASAACDECWDRYGPDEGPSCSICDALGHGYPGGGPCPLEERGYWDAEEERSRYGW